MKKFIHKYRFALSGIAFLLAGCAVPQAMTFNVDVMQPKGYIFNIDEQSVSVVATYDKTENDSIITADIARGVARALEEDNALEENAVGAFTIPAEEYSGTSDTLYLEQLMLATGSENLVIISDIQTDNITVSNLYRYGVSTVVGRLPIKASISVYDAIAEETLYKHHLNDTLLLNIPYPQSGKLSKEYVVNYFSGKDSVMMDLVGRKIAKHLSPSWVTEEWMIIDYNSDVIWHKAYKDAMNFEWEDALKSWLNFTEDKDPQKASYAAFNIAVACQMLGNTELAEEWIAYSRQKYEFKEAKILNEYILRHKVRNK